MSIQRALSATVTLSFVFGLIGMVVIWASSMLIFRDDWDVVRSAALIATVGLLPALWASLTSWFLNAQERFGAGSGVLAITPLVTTIGMVVFVVVLGWGIDGGILATVLATIFATGFGCALVSRSGLRLNPSLDRDYFRTATRYGLSLGASHMLTVGLVRADLVFVYLLAGPISAGHYSVALTVGLLAVMPSISISVGTFPRLAGLPVDQADRLTAKVFRISMAGVALTSVGLAAITPLLIPLALGDEFRPAILPSLILLAGAAPWTAQWILSRAQAARGRTSMQLRVVGLSLIVMSLLDLATIGRFGLLGAAVSSAIAPAIGTSYCLWVYRRAEWWTYPLTELLPRRSDFGALISQALGLIRSRA